MSKPIWQPLPDSPQLQAYHCEADILFYGGAAGGGKTDLACGLALTAHKKSIIFRKEATQLTGVVDRLTSLMGGRKGYNGQEKIWRFGEGKQLELGSIPHDGAEEKYQGRPHDLIVYDEVPHFLEKHVRFVMGWLRNAEDPNQRCRVLMTGNPPTESQGDWIISFFAPWLDPKHPNPAEHGELRWFATIDGDDIEVEDNSPFVYEGGERIYDFDPADYEPEQIVKPMSRTFIPAKVTDNPHLKNTGYLSVLQGMPEPLRSQMLYGDFSAGRTDGEWQVIPTAWVDAAMDRWTNKPDEPMEAMGVDAVRGGDDKMVLAPRHGTWIGELIRYKGHEVPNGQTGASIVIKHLASGAIPCVDVIGYGSSSLDHLHTFNIPAVALNGAEGTKARLGKFKFRNKRALWYWQMREFLDPKNEYYVQLPNDSQLKADLCAPEYKLTAGGILIESKEDIKKRLGRSPDDGDAVVYAFAVDVSTMQDTDDYEKHDKGRDSTTGY